MNNGSHLFPDVHPAFEFVLLACEVGAGPAELTRLVDLRASERTDWRRELERAAGRDGSEVGNSIVLRNSTRLGEAPWTYERWTRTLGTLRDDATNLGQLRPLRELILDLVQGLHVTRDNARLQTVEDGESPAAGLVPVISGRDVQREGLSLPGRYWTASDQLSGREVVAEGDLLVRTLVSRGQDGPRTGSPQWVGGAGVPSL